MRKLLFLALLFPLAADAADVSVSWQNPTTRVDGSALPAADLRGTRVEFGSCNGAAFGVKAGEVVAPAGATAATVSLPPGTHCLRAFARASDGAGVIESGPSAVAQKVVPHAAPNPPTQFAVAGSAAYRLRENKRGELVARKVGEVIRDTPCGPERLPGLHEVSREDVRLDRKARGVIVAPCV